MSEDVKVSTNVRPQNTGPNSRLRMGEYVLAVVKTETPTQSNNQEVTRVNQN